MNLIQQFEALIRGGIVLNLKIAATGENIQLDFIPAGKDTKTGVSLPARAMIGTAAELDEALAGFVPKYVGSLTRISNVVADAEAELAEAEAAAAAQAKQAVQDKAKNKGTKPLAKSTSGPAKRDPGKGLLGDDGDDAGDEGGDGTAEPEGEGETTLKTTGTASAPAPVGGQGGNALDASLF